MCTAAVWRWTVVIKIRLLRKTLCPTDRQSQAHAYTTLGLGPVVHTCTVQRHASTCCSRSASCGAVTELEVEDAVARLCPRPFHRPGAVTGGFTAAKMYLMPTLVDVWRCRSRGIAVRSRSRPSCIAGLVYACKVAQCVSVWVAKHKVAVRVLRECWTVRHAPRTLLSRTVRRASMPSASVELQAIGSIV